jgi:F-type H+-transporting ATPase subunit b
MKLGLIILLMTTDLVAAEGYQQGPLSSLILPFLNFSAVVIFLLVMMRKSLRALFEKNAKEIKELYYHAEEKEKEAKIKLQMYEEKMASLASEKNQIAEKTSREIIALEKTIQEETRLAKNKIEIDGQSKLQHEESMMIRELNESLLNEVIAKAKNSVVSDKAIQKGITTKLSSEARL